MSIVVQQICKSYLKQRALDHVSFEVIPNQIMGFLGPNGAGKSTTMKIITGIIPADQGEVFINGKNIKESGNTLKKTIGYLPEHNPLYEDMYVLEILEFEANVHKLPNKVARIDEVIQMTGLQSERHKKIQQLSKGYRQRVGLAMAIIHDPAILILDEPTSGLDPNQILEIRALIRELGKEKTVLFSTHIMQEVEAICDNILILSKGRVMDCLPLTEIQQKYPRKTIEEVFVQLTQ
ncbi:ATP-binding cassette domain-containing protein [Sphingobacterium sp. SYP-B4668]|uniref:ATP-binding cassette domain-containing protein n=1 Tax=Sphingobacterium sp. SYP-B4668 TaxID=2996035 RepID=UPI0005326313|nr:ATP-binding cassette domain-containing protein [Sphingobacterium sp. SYP-B4668]